MKHVLLLATTTGYQIRSFGEAAEKLGVRLTFASDRCDHIEDPWADRAIPVRFWDEAGSVEAVVAACADTVPDAIIAVGDRPAVLAACVAESLGLPGNPPSAVRASRNKLASRRAFEAAGLLTPTYYDVSIDDAPASTGRCLQFPRGDQATRAVRESWCDAGRSAERLRVGVRASGPADAGARHPQRARRGA
jgi:biotin carboxylase